MLINMAMMINFDKEFVERTIEVLNLQSTINSPYFLLNFSHYDKIV